MRKTSIPLPRILAGYFVVALAIIGADPSAAGPILDVVKERGLVKCGVTDGRPGVSVSNFRGRWTGTDVEYCRAVASIVFGDRLRVTIVAVPPERRAEAVRSGEVDLVASTAIAPAGATEMAEFAFPVVRFIDGLTFLVRHDAGVDLSSKLRDPTVCMVEYVPSEIVVSDHLRQLGLRFLLWTFAAYEDAIETYEDGMCDILADAATTLAEERLGLTRPDDHKLLRERLTEVPIGPMMKAGDDDWRDVLRLAHELVEAGPELPASRPAATLPSTFAK